MLTNLTIFLSGIIMGTAISFSLIYMSKFKEYIELKEERGSVRLKIFTTLLKVILPVVFGVVTLVLPIKILCVFFSDANLIKDLSSYYLYSFVCSFFLCTLLLIKTKKLKTKNTLK